MMGSDFRYAICNEAFKDYDFREACQVMRKTGYTGIEIAPFTLADDPTTITPGQRAEYRRIMAGEGLTFVGLHWIMVSPKGLHVTTPDAELRARSWQHIRNLVDLCADLGPGGVMVFGSPFQRGTTGGLSREQATRNYIDGLAQCAPHAEDRGVKILVEALPAGQCDVVQSLEEAAGIVAEIGSPAIQTMFDTHNAVDEVESHALLVDRYFDVIRHVHVNEMDGKHPGRGDYDFKPVLGVLKQRGFSGWVSLEAFDFSFGAETIAVETIQYLKKEEELLPA
ncbi:MAG: sugar phosphate isomerase/epimerase family protein [Bryobacteraceae bacterium]|nr:sugar phosphate isomerase/epimerase family protein [Bryobacteraceae bacterium]